jgi:hypothetical protein
LNFNPSKPLCVGTSPHLLESKLGMRVKIPPQLGEKMQIGSDFF